LFSTDYLTVCTHESTYCTHESTVVIVLHNILLLHACDNENSTVAHAIRHTKLAEHATY